MPLLPAIVAAALALTSDGTLPQVARLVELERPRVIADADRYLGDAPVTVTASRAVRSAGGPHDFFSEGDYWWPDPDNPSGPYVQRDGQTNPQNFVAHRHAMVRFSVHTGTLTSAFLFTGDRRYADHAWRHLRAWFVDPATRMSPHLRYAQAISGRVTGRGIGIIDTIHLVEVARAVDILTDAGTANPRDVSAVRTWFAEYLAWLTTHPYGLDERDTKNNHATCWVMQVAAFASVAGRLDLLDDARRRFRDVLLPGQMSLDGSFPLELQRTKPYGYSIFNLDAFATICQLLTTADDNLWTFELPDGRGMRKGLAFLVPFLRDKSTWPHKPDVMHFDEWPVRQPSLLFAGLAFGRTDLVEVWAALPPPGEVEEVRRNMPIRHPVLWLASSEIRRDRTPGPRVTIR